MLICCSRDQDQDPKSKTDPGPRKKIGPDPGIQTDPDPERKIDPEKETDPDPGKRTDLHLEGGRDQDQDPEEERGRGQEDVTDPDPGRGTGTVMTEDVMHGKGSFCGWLVFILAQMWPLVHMGYQVSVSQVSERFHSTEI